MTAETVTVETLVEQLAPPLLAYFTRRVGDAADAADLLAETLLVLWRRADDVPAEPGQARLWAFGVARRVLSTYRRAGVRRSALTARLRSELEAAGPAPGGETVDRVREAILRLHPTDQEVVRLVHWDGFTLAEAAELLGRRPGTIRSRYHRARQQLRADLTAGDRD